jgi:F420-dependent oxidoreductase-like protein
MKLRIGLHTGPQNIPMEELRRIWQRADDAGFYWISVWDHFYANPLREREDPCFEGVASMAALAALTKRVRVGCLVFCTLFRTPGMLAKAATTIDHISGGRLELGLGAGWFEEEFTDFGYGFPSLGRRMDQMEEAVQIIRSMLHEGASTFHGEFYDVDNAVCAPKPVQRRPRIWIGGRGSKRTPRMAAQYADGFNVPYLGPEEFKARQEALDAACEKIGRDPKELTRTVNLGFYMGADEKGAEKHRKTLEALGHAHISTEGNLQGTPAQVVDRIGQYIDAGASGLNIALRPPLDWEAFEAFIAQVMPHVHEFGD